LVAFDHQLFELKSGEKSLSWFI